MYDLSLRHNPMCDLLMICFNYRTIIYCRFASKHSLQIEKVALAFMEVLMVGKYMIYFWTYSNTQALTICFSLSIM